MKKIILTIASTFLAIGIYAQQWNGSNNTTSNINRTGNVAIGTTDTSSGKLTIKQNSGDGNTSGIRLSNSGNSQSSFFYMDGNNKMRFDNGGASARDFIFNNGGDGNVGIGEYSPSARLAIKQKTADDHFSGVQLKNNNNQSSFFWMSSNNILNLENSSTGNGKIVFNANGSGNVGIGVDDPSERLTVDGMVYCTEVKVESDVTPDYVFQKYYNGVSTLNADYTMPTLEEVEAYTKANHHLPAMPSAKEVQENGLHLKEMTNLLLQKIEELTLYTIEQEKRINALEIKLATKE